MMRIVFVAWHGSPHTRRWALFFAERGHDVHVVTCGDTPTRQGEDLAPEVLPYSVHELGPPRGGKLGYLAKVPRARRLIRSLSPDLVHAHYATSYGLLGSAAGVRPLVVTAHGSDILLAPRNPVLRGIVRRVLRSADLVTVPGEHLRQAVKHLLRGRTPRIVVFQYGVETPRLAELGRSVRTSTPAGSLRIVTARPLEPIYHTDVVLQAVALLVARGHTFAYDIAGDGSEQDALRALAGKLHLDHRVAFHGFVTDAAVEALLARADVYVSMAESDGVSIALLEALALGAIPVLSDIPANRIWVVDGENGALAGIDPHSLAEAIEQALDLDRTRVREENLRLVRERADRETNLRLCESLLTELVAGAAGSDRPPS